jgi:hypothetical protein
VRVVRAYAHTGCRKFERQKSYTEKARMIQRTTTLTDSSVPDTKDVRV